MKKIIAVSLIAMMLSGCATGPEKGHYVTDPVTGEQKYEASADAKNEDTWTTLGAVAAGAAAIAGLTLGIVAVTK